MTEPARLAEVLGSLSLATDLAAGLPAETAIRTSLVAVRLGAAAGVQGFELADVYFTGLLRFLGCSAFSHEMAERYAAGDDLGLLRELTTADPDRSAQVLRHAWRGIDRRAPAGARAAALVRLATEPSAAARLAVSHCELAVLLARRLGMSEGVVQALSQIYERWDGRGAPARLRGDAIRRPARLLHVAWRLATHLVLEGVDAAIDVVARRRGREFEPGLADVVAREGRSLVAGLDRPTSWSDFLAAEPRPWAHVAAGRLEDAAAAFGHFADVKSPWTAGHSARVARAAAAAGAASGLDGDACRELRIAGLLHDIGRAAVPNGIWDKRGPFDAMERERAHAHSAETQRILDRSPLLAPFAALAGAAHERLDGNGYHRGLPGAALSRPARLLAAADVFCALQEERPHRAALEARKAADTLAAEAASGRLDPDAVAAVLAAAGHEPPPAAAPPSVLTAREIEVLRLVARGLVNKEIAARLYISPSTVKRHLENVFAKIGVRTRAAVAVWALENHQL